MMKLSRICGRSLNTNVRTSAFSRSSRLRRVSTSSRSGTAISSGLSRHTVRSQWRRIRVTSSALVVFSGPSRTRPRSGSGTSSSFSWPTRGFHQAANDRAGSVVGSSVLDRPTLSQRTWPSNCVRAKPPIFVPGGTPMLSGLKATRTHLPASGRGPSTICDAWPTAPHGITPPSPHTARCSQPSV